MLDAINKNEYSNTNVKTASESAGLKLSTDFQHFVKLLVTQLKNQDPTEPLEAHQFTEQIVSFTQVEQSVATNANLEKLIQLNSGMQFNHATSLVGQEVSYDGSISDIKMGEVTDFGYKLEPNHGQEVKNVNIKVLNEKNVIVSDINTEGEAGNNIFHWNGIDNNKKKCDKGRYKIIVKAHDQDGNPVIVGSSIFSGTVERAEIIDGDVFVNVNNKKIQSSKIISVDMNKKIKQQNN